MANTVDKVINTAKAELGYLEKSKKAYMANKSILYKKTEGAGDDNYTKYGKEMHEIYPSVMDFPAAWCDAFVDWVFYKSFGISTAKSLLGGNFNDYTVASKQMYVQKGAYHKSNPKPGDQIFFKRASGTLCHTGLVIAVDKNYVHTIEGNTNSTPGVVRNGGAVNQKKYILSHRRIDGYGRPKYDTVISEPKLPKVTDKPKVDKPPVIKKEKYLKKYTGDSPSIVNALKSIGVDSSKENRLRIAKLNGIKNYFGTVEQNLKMLTLLKAGKLKG